ncbi:unnamed protein product [Echinostoma caproni]|uniref:Zinc transporter ZIP3 n=1 Tax=Echinostoma caproni TaxID=27848 RepID=A0A183AGP8_9TREM|nr:unnamed protein product [Echinostoma caproni]
MRSNVVHLKLKAKNETDFITSELHEPQDLTGPKLGLAAVMFLYVALACTIPLIFFHLMQDRAPRRKSSGFTESSESCEPQLQVRETQTLSRSFCARCCKWTPELREIFIGRSNCLAAGALLCVGFLDVFMETIEAVEEALKTLHIDSHFPIASFTTLLGFLLILGVEQITLDYYHQQGRSQVSLTSKEGTDYQGVTIRRFSSTRQSIRDRAVSLTGVVEGVAVAPSTMDPVVETTEDSKTRDTELHEGHSHVHTSTVISTSWIRVMILLFAISLHSVFEGMALGLTGSLTSLLTLFAALSLHKLIIAISIGINLATETSESNQQSAHQRRKLFIYQSLAVLTFAGASPLGVLIGWAVTNQSESVEFLLTQAILQGLACGTFCYVVFCELLPKELQEEKGDKPGKFFFLVLGFALVAFVIAFGPSEN